ncbi:hypothetical protein ACFPL7_09270 [Dongia soli]|uniref:Phosphatidate cytidylyltransferase n=1 Tax=Dongia soli TaxID=600628 RepID=A0ABU5E9Y2_9PROT|nr:hypothetical protein [Dongia soli]MDY0883138.1 hypothetical protein [Dongia soli]
MSAQPDPKQALTGLIAAELAQPVAQAARDMAEAVRRRHGSAIAVLFYGSCLRQPETQLADSLLDFYLLVDDYKAAYNSAWLALANRLLPPNVFYLEIPFGTGKLRTKYAVISLAQFRRGTSSAAANVSLWARFSQPARLIWHRDQTTAAAVADACAEAVLTMLGAIRPQLPETENPERLWVAAFQATYRAELRPEGSDRAHHIYESDRTRYDRITAAALQVLRRRNGEGKGKEAGYSWESRRRIGKLLNIARLLKAAFTFDGGLDYILWKVKRHSGVSIPVTHWQRRHPVLAAPLLAWRLYRRGAFR